MSTLEKIREYAKLYDISIDVVKDDSFCDTVIGYRQIYKDGKPYAYTGDCVPLWILQEGDDEQVMKYMEKWHRVFEKSLRIFLKYNHEDSFGN